jgi:hypothetical protein
MMGEQQPDQLPPDDSAGAADRVPSAEAEHESHIELSDEQGAAAGEATEGSGLSGFFELPEGILPDLDAEFGSVDSTAADDPTRGDEGDEVGSEFSEFAELDNPEMAADLIGETSQDELAGGWESSDDFDEATEADAHQRFVRSADSVSGGSGGAMGTLRPRPLRRSRPNSSLLGVLIGGLLAIPIVVAILLWGFRRDDFGIGRMLPESLSFLMPVELRTPRRVRERSLPDPRDLPRLPAEGLISADDPLVAALAGNPESREGETALKGASGAELTLLGGNEPGERSAEDALLDAADLAMLEMAAARAGVMLDSVTETPSDAPETMRKSALVDWYKSLAAVGEEAVAAEQVLADAGRATTSVGGALTGMVERIAGTGTAYADLQELAQLWLKATKRDSQGAVIPGTLSDVHPVGAVWASTLIGLEQGSETSLVTVLSRRRPDMPVGTDVVAVGVMVGGDVMWAACLVGRDAVESTDTSESPLSTE